eukprot:1316267-Lingulodinium_polyedra.AAC.1
MTLDPRGGIFTQQHMRRAIAERLGQRHRGRVCVGGGQYCGGNLGFGCVQVQGHVCARSAGA